MNVHQIHQKKKGQHVFILFIPNVRRVQSGKRRRVIGTQFSGFDSFFLKRTFLSYLPSLCRMERGEGKKKAFFYSFRVFAFVYIPQTEFFNIFLRADKIVWDYYFIYISFKSYSKVIDFKRKKNKERKS